MSSLVRNLVSKKKKRFLEDGFDLDLTYIRHNIIAMGFPADNVEGMYRNSMADVVRFLDLKHNGHYKVYNLCSERIYDKSRFHGRVAHYPFEDHNAPPLDLLLPFCEDVHDYLQADQKNVVVIHCKAGKGRTGVMICAYMLFAGMFGTAEEALKFYGEARTSNAKGVTIPSQLRYVSYFAQILQKKLAYEPFPVFLKAVRLSHPPRVTNPAAVSKELGMLTCNPLVNFYIKNTKVWSSKSGSVYKDVNDGAIVFDVGRPVPLCGDVKVEFLHRNALKNDKMFHFWFNTYFTHAHKLAIKKEMLDKAIKDKLHKIFDQHFTVTLEFVDSSNLGSQGAETSNKTSMSSTVGTLNRQQQQKISAATTFGSNSSLANNSNSDSNNNNRTITVDDFEYDAGDIEDMEEAGSSASSSGGVAQQVPAATERIDSIVAHHANDVSTTVSYPESAMSQSEIIRHQELQD